MGFWDEPWIDALDDAREYASHEERVLVAVVPRPQDWARVLAEGWYRIPYNRAPRQMGAEYLAFYHPGAYPEPLRHTISYYAPVRRYRLVRRCELLPDEADHPRADDLYYRIDLGPLEMLPRPVPSPRLRRVTFIMTTLPRLFQAREIGDLWLRETRVEARRRAYRLRESSSSPWPPAPIAVYSS
ncbi:MAG: hypothetical protein ACOX9A_10810 [Anaerolineae bacterium]|jgi:hypothetical protein